MARIALAVASLALLSLGAVAPALASPSATALRRNTSSCCLFIRFGLASLIVFIFSNPRPIHVHHIGTGSAT